MRRQGEQNQSSAGTARCCGRMSDSIIHLQREAMDHTNDIQRFQEGMFSNGYDYRAGSPHLKHWKLHERLVSAAKNTLADVIKRNLPLKSVRGTADSRKQSLLQAFRRPQLKCRVLRWSN
jgi:hypothetical protein